MEACANHPQHAAIEHCEVCGRALCGLCLWYSEDGHRLCEAHAGERREAGERVLEPATYAEAISASLIAHQQGAATQSEAGMPYRGNIQDLSGLLATVVAITTLFSCMGGAYCLPAAALLLGILAYANSARAVDPRRTRLLAGIGMGVGGLMFLLVALYVGVFVAFFLVAVLAGSLGP